MRTTNTMIYVNVVNPLILGTQGMEAKAQDINIYPNPPPKKSTHHSYFIFSQKWCNGFRSNECAWAGGHAPPINLTPNPSAPPGEGSASIDISKLPAGMYFLQLKSESGSVVKKFVKE